MATGLPQLTSSEFGAVIMYARWLGSLFDIYFQGELDTDAKRDAVAREVALLVAAELLRVADLPDTEPKNLLDTERFLAIGVAAARHIPEVRGELFTKRGLHGVFALPANPSPRDKVVNQVAHLLLETVRQQGLANAGVVLPSQ